MLDVPLNNRIVQLVVNLASRREAQIDTDSEGSQASEDDSVKKELPFILERESSNDSESRQRNTKRTRRDDRGEKGRWRLYGANSGPKHDVKKIRHIIESTIDPGFGGKDPFGAFALPNDVTTDLALHHWVDVFQKTRMSINPRQAWMRINLSDKTLLSVTTYCSFSHFYFIRGIRAPPSCLPQKLNAIQNINETLRRRGAIPSDYTMVAVAVMTILECLAGEPKACAIHRKGLQLMVQSRGGLQTLGFGGAAAKTVSWADTCCAILRRTKPSLRPILTPDVGETELPSRTDAGFIVTDLEERLLPLTLSTELSEQIIYIWLRLRYLTEFLGFFPNEKTTLDDCYFSDKIDFVERYIIGILYSERLAESETVAFFTAFLNASLIFTYEQLRECPKWTNVCMSLSQRIYSGLEMADIFSVTEHCPDLFLWVLLLGRSGNSPHGELSKEWYQNGIAEFEEKMGIEVPPVVEELKYFEIAEQASPHGNRTVHNLDLKPRFSPTD